jgi:tetratricopeptide (TPR) repeat protein
MSETIVAAAEVGAGDATSARLEALYEAGLYRQALDVAEADWGPLRHWQGEERRLTASRLASQLGLFRTAAALVLVAWRAARRDGGSASFDLHYAYLRTLFNLNGPYIARRALRRLEPGLVMTPEQQARWQGLAAVIHGAYRDWDTAHACIDAAMRHSETPDDYLFERAWLQELQDRYDEALASLAALPAGTPNAERARAQSRARLLEITGQREAAVALLQETFARIESIDLGLRLHRMLLEDGALDAADACLERLRRLAPAGEAGTGQDLAIAAAELLYRRGDVDGAFAALAPVRGYFFRKVREALERARHSGTRRLLDVPFIRQHHMTCAPATFAAIWRYHGHALDHLTLAEAICYDGTSDLAERRWMEAQGWAVREFELNLDDIVTLIDAGCPVGLATVEPGSAHMQAIIGYDTRRGVYLLRDPYYPSVQELLIDGAHEAYAASGPRCIVAVPPERRDWLFALPLRQAACYDDYFALQQALADNRRDDALAAAARLEAAAPGHRLALWAARSIAGYDNDVLRQLHLVNALLEQFPEDLNLLVAKARMLGDLGREAERLHFLEACRQRGIRHPFLLQALAEQMAQDNRRMPETQALLHDILRRQPTSAAAWWTRAGVHWDELEREEAFECYRLCVCLEDKVEGYATSYFKAARFLRREGEALDYLKRRIEWLGARSANPWITYARALDLLERTRESIAVLEEALQKHPEDAWLVDEAVGLLCNAGEYERAERLLAENGAVLSEVARLYKQARIVAARGEAGAELDCYRRILELQPRNERAAAQIARLLQDTESTAAALAFLDGQLAANPHNLWLLHEKLAYVARLPLEERRPLVAAMHALHPEDSRLTLAWVRLLRSEGRQEEALRLVQQAVGIDADEERVHLALGDVCMEMDRREQARAAYERAILISVDADGAFEKLLATHVAFEDKQKALQFIHGELMRQVSLGNGILEFQALARRYLPDIEVRAFLDVAVEERADLWQSWVALGGFLSETHQLDDALAVLDRAVERFPLLPRLWLDRGEVQRLRGDYAAAESDIRAALAINPGYALAATRLADVLELQVRPADALAAIEAGLKRDPQYVAFYGYRADLLWRMERRDEAFDTLLRALRIDAEYGWAWNQLPGWGEKLGRRAEVEALAEALLAQFPDAVNLWKQAADIATDRARKHECLQRALALAPQRSDLLLARCDLFAEDGRIDEARALIAEAYAGREKPSDVLTYEAWMTEETGRLAEAIAQLETVVKQDPGHYNAWRLLTRWHDAAGHGEDCCRCARQCVALYPQNATVLGMAAEFLLRHLDKDNEVARRLEARDYLQRALNQDHTNLYNVLTLADLYLDEGDLDDCEQLFARLLVETHNPYVVARHLRLAVLRGKVEEAQAHYAFLLQCNEDSDWLLLEPLRWFRDAAQKDAARACLAAAAQSPATPARAGRAWMALLLDGSDVKTVQAALKAVAAQRDFWREALVYALGQDHASTAHLAPLFTRLEDDFRQDARLWTALVNYRMAEEDWLQLAMLSRPGGVPDAAAARAVYFCNVAWRMHHRWDRARELSQQAAALPRDDSHHNLMFWEQFDAGLADFAAVDAECLAALDQRELTRVERLLCEVLQALAGLPPAPAQSRQVHAALAECWKRHPDLLSNKLVRMARRQLWWAVWRQAQGPLWQRLARATWYAWL